MYYELIFRPPDRRHGCISQWLPGTLHCHKTQRGSEQSSCQSHAKAGINCQFIFRDQSENLQQFTVGRSQGHQGHLAGQARDLLHQEGHLGCPGLPVLHLYLGPKVIPLNPQLFTFHQEVLDSFHPLFQVAFKSENLQ